MLESALLRRNGNEYGLGILGRQYDFLRPANMGVFMILIGCLKLCFFSFSSYVKHTPFQRRSC